MNDTNRTTSIHGHPSWQQCTIAGLGATLALLAICAAESATGTPWLLAPLGASCALAFGAHESPFSQPRNLVGGHLLATFIALGLFHFTDGAVWAMAVSAGLTLALMMAFRMFHPPAGATPLVIFASKASWAYAFTPVFSGAALIVVTAWAYHRVGKQSYPHRWW
jgi:CBS-domain-containing membrane protein